MSAEHNRALVERYFADCVNQVNGSDREAALGIVNDLMTEDFAMVFNSEDFSQADRGTKRHVAFLVEHARNYPDDEWTVESIIAADDAVACVWRIRSRHAGSGNQIDIRAGDFFGVRNGRLSDLRRFLDFEDLHRQTGRTTPA